MSPKQAQSSTRRFARPAVATPVLGFAPSAPRTVAATPEDAMKNLPIALAFAVLLAACGKEGADQTATTAPRPKAAAPLDQPAAPAPPASAADITGARLDRILARRLALGREQGARSIPPSEGDADVLRRQGRRDRHRNHSGRRLVHRNPGAADEGQRHLHRRGRQAEEARRRSRARQHRTQEEIRRRRSRIRRGQDRRIRRQGAELRRAGLGRCRADVPQRAQLGDGGNAPAMFKAFYDVLKPGGVLGVVDHRAADGADRREDQGHAAICRPTT